LARPPPPDPPLSALHDALPTSPPPGQQAALRRRLTRHPARPDRARPASRPQMELPVPSQYGSRRRRLSSLPLGSRGISPMKSIDRGHFIRDSRPSSEARMSAARSGPGWAPSSGSTTALTATPPSSSLTPNPPTTHPLRSPT